MSASGQVRPWLPRARDSRLLLVVCGLYSAVAALLFLLLGLLQSLDQVMFSAPDARGYLRLSNFILGGEEADARWLATIRPFLYPLFLSLHRVLGVPGFFLTQWALNLATVVITFRTARRLTRSTGWALLGVGLLLSNLTFTFISLHALSETLGFFLFANAILMLDDLGRFVAGL